MRLILLPLFFFTHHFILAQTFDLTITINNIKADEGRVQIGIYNQKENFPHKGKEFKMISFEAKAPTITITVEDLPQGDYAIALYHDLNSDNKINKNIIGVPKEGYGFSNNVKPLFSAPSFEKAKFKLDSDTSITISLIH